MGDLENWSWYDQDVRSQKIAKHEETQDELDDDPMDLEVFSEPENLEADQIITLLKTWWWHKKLKNWSNPDNDKLTKIFDQISLSQLLDKTVERKWIKKMLRAVLQNTSCYESLTEPLKIKLFARALTVDYPRGNNFKKLSRDLAESSNSETRQSFLATNIVTTSYGNRLFSNTIKDHPEDMFYVIKTYCRVKFPKQVKKEMIEQATPLELAIREYIEGTKDEKNFWGNIYRAVTDMLFWFETKWDQLSITKVFDFFNSYEVKWVFEDVKIQQILWLKRNSEKQSNKKETSGIQSKTLENKFPKED